MNRFARCSAAGAVVLLLAAGCSSATDNTQIASGPGEPVATTPPLAIPPILRQPESSVADVMPETLATTSPLTMPTEAPPTSTTVAAATAPGTNAPDPTVMPIASSTAAATPIATVSTPTSTSTSAAAAVTPVPAEPAPPAVAAPATNGANAATIPLGDFEVVNLVTGSNQNIAELSPSGATMLWFWAPH